MGPEMRESSVPCANAGSAIRTRTVNLIKSRIPAVSFVNMAFMRNAIRIAGLLCLALGISAVSGQDTPTPGKDGWISMFDGKTLDGWKANERPESWKVVDGAIVGDGPVSHLFWMTRECENCEFRAEIKLNHSGNSGMYVRAAFGP